MIFPALASRWRLVLLLACAAALNYADRAAYSSVLLPLRQELGLSDATLGLLGSLFLWSYALASPLAGVLADRFSRRTLVLVGHLPVMSGLWLSQYADREARESGPVCLVRLAADSVQLELFRTGSRRPSIRPQATYEEALRAIGPTVSHWLVVPQHSHAEAIEIPEGTDDIVVLTGADQAAIVAAYKLVKWEQPIVERCRMTQLGKPSRQLCRTSCEI